MTELDAKMTTEQFVALEPEKLSHGIEKFTDENGIAGFEADESTLPKGYFTSSFFIGSMTAICLGLFAGVSGFSYAAPVLAIINADIGPVS
jgi:hypothetical protein